MSFSEDRNKLVTRASALVPVHAQKQRRRMLIALVLLLFALLLVFIRDRQYWFPPVESTGSAAPTPAASVPVETQTAPPPIQKQRIRAAKSKARAAAPVPAAQAEIQPQAIISNRAVLPPLQVEVVAGDQRRTVHPGNPSVNVELQPPPSAPPDTVAADSSITARAPTTDASERVRLSPDTSQVVSNPVRPNYPTLARQMKVQGSVVLQALIGKSGSIQDLQVLSGPSILSSAAQEAVKQWRFKPYYQNGQPVETQCSITVNFTISTQ